MNLLVQTSLCVLIPFCRGVKQTLRKIVLSRLEQLLAKGQ